MQNGFDPAVLKKIENIEDQLLQMHKPNNYNMADPENILLDADRTFERLCCSLEDHGIQRPEELSEFKFYSRIEHIEQKARQGNSSKEFVAE